MPSLISAIWQFRRAINDLSKMPAGHSGPRAVYARRRRPIQPADVNRQLEKAMLLDENLLEDVNYGRVVPNEYVVELNEDHYEHQYRPIERQVVDQWRDRLLTLLNITNSRYGAKKFHFGGPVQVRLQPVTDLAANEVRVQGHINAAVPIPQPAAAAACLEQVGGGRRWTLREGVTLVGRDPACDIHLDVPLIQQRRLVSSRHAFLRCEGGRCRLHDGAPGGKPSVNGTYVNGRRILAAGIDLNEGDLIVLAALDPADPRPDTPGVAALIFHASC